MDDDQLARTLQSVGMAAFVTHLDLFEGPAPHGEAAATLQHRMGITAKAARTRVSHARAILAADRRADALDRIAAASRVPESIRAAARAARRNAR